MHDAVEFCVFTCYFYFWLGRHWRASCLPSYLVLHSSEVVAVSSVAVSYAAGHDACIFDVVTVLFYTGCCMHLLPGSMHPADAAMQSSEKVTHWKIDCVQCTCCDSIAAEHTAVTAAASSRGTSQMNDYAMRATLVCTSSVM